MQREQLIGKVVNRLTKQKTFKLELKDGTRVEIDYPYDYAPFQEGDILSCYCTITDDGYKFESIVDVLLGQDKNTFLSLFARALPNCGFLGKSLSSLYDSLKKLQESDAYKEHGSIADLLSYFAECYLKGNNSNEIVALLCKAKMLVNGTPKPILNPEKAKKLLEWWSENYDMRRLYCLGLTFAEIDETEMTPFKLYKELEKNPYAVPGIALEKCPGLNLRLQRIGNVYDRPFGEFVRELYKNSKKRCWTCTPIKYLRNKLTFTLNDDNRRILTDEFRVVFEQVPVYKDNDLGKGTNETVEEMIYLKQFYKASKIVYDFIMERVTDKPYANLNEPTFLDTELDEYQRAAVTMAMKENICIICGPAGSGKTRTLRTIIQNLELQERDTVVTAFTGKAVIRAKQLNGISEKAATIHRMLYGSGPQEFDDVIFEESSMISTPLLAKFITKYKNRKYRAIFVGDPNQLPPIEWGSMFAGMITSRSIPKVELKSIHRQKTKDGKEDGIIKNTTKLCTWPDNVDFIYDKTENFRVEQGGPDKLFDYIEELKRNGESPLDVTVLSPYRVRACGGKTYEHVLKINQVCQLIWNRENPSQKGPDQDPRVWYIGDRVMVNKNVYEGIDIFNGQEGTVTGVSAKGVQVTFPVDVIEKIDANSAPLSSDNSAVKFALVAEQVIDEKYKKFTYNKVVDIPFPGKTEKRNKRILKVNGQDDNESLNLTTKLIDLSFAMTIHKSQGSEWKTVVVLTPGDAPTGGGFLNRSIYYTAKTRASEKLFLLDGCMKLSTILGKPLPHRHDSLINKLKHSLDRLHDYVERKIEVVDVGFCEGIDEFDFM